MLRRIVVALALVLATVWFVGDSGVGLSCPDDCSDRGTCVFEGPLNRERKGWIWSRVCACDPGWTSDNCSLCSSSDACPGRQVCRFGRCTCAVGWAGENCDRCYSSVACGGNGACFEDHCVCAPGWAGIDCQIEATRTNPDR